MKSEIFYDIFYTSAKGIVFTQGIYLSGWVGRQMFFLCILVFCNYKDQFCDSDQICSL